MSSTTARHSPTAQRVGDRVIAAGVELEPGDYDVRLTAAHPDSTAALPGSTGLVKLDITVTPELAAEGTARDVVRVVQQARREAGPAVSDRIRLTIGADRDGADAVRAHQSLLAGETLAVDVVVVPAAHLDAPASPVGEGGVVRVLVAAASGS